MEELLAGNWMGYEHKERAQLCTHSKESLLFHGTLAWELLDFDSSREREAAAFVRLDSRGKGRETKILEGYDE